MKLKDVHKWEKAVIQLLNFDGWDLEWCGGGFEHYDAVGGTPKGKECVIEMKFRQSYYQTKMLEKYKFDKLMDMPSDLVKLYFINDPKGNYLFYLNDIVMPDTELKYCPDTTIWTKHKKEKEVYLLDESQAVIVNINDPKKNY
jgi:hypothetical protein